MWRALWERDKPWSWISLVGRRSVKLRGEGLRSSARREKSDFTECPRALGTLEGALEVEEVTCNPGALRVQGGGLRSQGEGLGARWG